MDVLPLWKGDLLMAPLLSFGLIWAARKFRDASSRRWLFGTLFALGYMTCVAVASLHEQMSRVSERYAHTLANGVEPSHLTPEWGKDLSPSDRTRHSQMLARWTYVSYGMRVKFFDLDGAMQEFVPAEDDVKSREFHIRHLAETRSNVTTFSIVAVGWLLMPLAAIGLSLLPIWRRRIGRPPS